VVGLTKVEAAQRLTEAGFEVQFLPSVHSERVPAQRIVAQDPEPDGRVLPGGVIRLTNSLGPDRRKVPAVVGMTQADAAAALAKAGLVAGPVTSTFASQPAGTVVGSSPAPATPLKPGTQVTLVVSKGPELLAVPDVTGQPRAAAVERLAEAGFEAAVTEVFSDTVRKGVVLTQDPATGRAPRDSTVQLQVSKGPELITVPDLVGERQAVAEQRLEALGLRVQIRAIPGPGKVRSTDPGAGAKVRKGSTVTLYVF
jgi:serine/threonine-protein kinase